MSGTAKGQTGKGTFTITEVNSDGWGKLKSGVGWIYLGNASYVTFDKTVSSGGTAKTETATASTTDDEKTIWNYLLGKIGNAYGTTGLMGNLYAESGLRSNNLQNTYEKKLGYTDESYTKAVDDGSYTNFVKGSAGYGLAQRTYWSRKQNLLNYATQQKKSIGDLEMQLGFLCQEIKGYSTVWSGLTGAKSVKAASDIVLMQYEKPANQGDSVKTTRASYGQKYYDKYAGTSGSTEKGGTTVGYTNSSLVNYTKLSPNNSGTRTHSIDRITPHCVVGQCSVETLGEIFYPSSIQASCQYGIGADGRVGMYCEEKNRSWCSSSNANDQRAVTIECASDTTAPYAFKNVVYKKLITLCVDICKRNGKKKLLWLGDKTKTLNYSPASDEMVLTVHRWFANKSCPGDWLMARMDDLATQVTKQLGGSTGTSGGTSGGNSTSTSLKQGDSGTAVKTMQTMLIACGYSCGSAGADGSFGANTLAAVKKFQKAQGLTVDGIYGPKTKAALEKAYKAKTSSSSAGMTNADCPFTVKVSIDDLNIRKGAGTNTAKTGKTTGKGTFTITQVKSGKGSTKGWGKLNSGAGWISLDYCTKV